MSNRRKTKRERERRPRIKPDRETPTRLVPMSKLQLREHPSTVPLSEREGIYVHSFQCGSCDLHYMTFSWRAERHRRDTIRCPECGEVPVIHFRVILSESTTFNPNNPTEICRLFPWPGSERMTYANDGEVHE